VLQHTATHCNILQHAAIRRWWKGPWIGMGYGGNSKIYQMCCCVMQGVAVWCVVLCELHYVAGVEVHRVCCGAV